MASHTAAKLVNATTRAAGALLDSAMREHQQSDNDEDPKADVLDENTADSGAKEQPDDDEKKRVDDQIIAPWPPRVPDRQTPTTNEDAVPRPQTLDIPLPPKPPHLSNSSKEHYSKPPPPPARIGEMLNRLKKMKEDAQFDDAKRHCGDVDNDYDDGLYKDLDNFEAATDDDETKRDEDELSRKGNNNEMQRIKSESKSQMLQPWGIIYRWKDVNNNDNHSDEFSCEHTCIIEQQQQQCCHHTPTRDDRHCGENSSGRKENVVHNDGRRDRGGGVTINIL